ncbi:hypothetical protein OG613_48075 (plasmid) [Streptomyces sp. NBC_00015]|uniref:hypothetical protein n=1 Tax=Streptomyces sp. NBC_00015 TaxID=2903611 RepID=UPI002F918675
MNSVDPREVIASSLGGMVDYGRAYARDLPEELACWHCYTLDGGHSILVALDDGTLGDAPTLEKIVDMLVPAPVKAVERAGWRTWEGFVVCNLPYDPTLGLVTDPADDEYGDGSDESETSESAEPVMTMLAVGEPYPGRVQWRDGACEISITQQGVDFVLALANPTTHEVKAFRKGNAEFALVPGRHHLMWAYKFTDPQDSDPRHGIQWSDQPWEYHRQAAGPAAAVPAGRGGSFQLQLVLVDASTGVVEALRMIGPSVEFADALRDAVEAQASVPHDPAAANRELESVYTRYKSSTDLVLVAEARFEALRDGTAR